MATVVDGVWIYGYKHRYKITTKGEVYRITHKSNNHVSGKLWGKKISPYQHSSSGKCYVRIYTDKREDKYNLAQLMMKTFLGLKPKPNKECIVHRNGNIMDCAIDNIHILPIGQAQQIARDRRKRCAKFPMIVKPKKTKGEIYLRNGRYYTIDIS